jgi:site-specific DNA recombinase
MIDRSYPLVPKNPDGPLMTIALGRVSTTRQNVKNIDASYEDVERYLESIYDGPTCIKHLGEQGSGMLVDRASIMEAEREIETGNWDLVLMEDLSKAYRNPRHQYAFVQNCVDAETRVICTGDNLDTADPQWEVAMGSAALRHGLHIPDTRRRVRRTATYAFHHGGMVAKVKFGYRKLTREEADSGKFGPKGLRTAKVSEATPTFDEMRLRVHDGAGSQDLADWLNAAGIEPGPYVKKGYWTGKDVVNLLTDRILSGTRTFRNVNYRPIYRTGHHLRVKNPNPEREYVPELAHMTVEQQEEMLAKLQANSRRTHDPKRGPANPLYRKPRGESIFPAQHAECAACKGRMHRALNDQIKCRRAHRQNLLRCWNHVQVRCELARERILSWLLNELDKYPRHRDAFLDMAWAEHEQELVRRRHKLEEICEQIQTVSQEADKLAAAIAAGGELEALVKRSQATDAQLKKLRKAETQETHCLHEELTVISREELAARPLEGTLAVARRSTGFAIFLRRLFPEFEIVPVQSLDHKMVRPRARIVVALSELCRESDTPAESRVEIDLFEPPEHIKHLRGCLAAKAAHPALSLKRLAGRLGIGHMTVKRAFDYARRMEAAGVPDPYIVLTAAPDYASRWKDRPKKSCSEPHCI